MITAQIASLPARVETLQMTVNSLLPQVDDIFIALNGYKEVPEFLQNNPKIRYKLMDNSLGDAAKFYGVEKLDGYVLTCDDDLIYPEGYVGYMISGVKRHGGAVSLLGKRYGNRPVTSFRKGYTTIFRCLTRVINDSPVDVVGTGALAFHTDNIKISVEDFKRPNMADIWFSKAANEQGVPLIAITHPARYVNHKIYPWRIWTNDGHDEYQTEILNSFLHVL